MLKVYRLNDQSLYSKTHSVSGMKKHNFICTEKNTKECKTISTWRRMYHITAYLKKLDY